MPSMSVTLAVSKLSGWLKASAPCRVARWAYDARGRCGPGGERAVRGGDGASGIAGKGFRLEVGARVRTENMLSMVVTLDVSRPSGWLKASAFCRSQGGHTMGGGEVRAGT